MAQVKHWPSLPAAEDDFFVVNSPDDHQRHRLRRDRQRTMSMSMPTSGTGIMSTDRQLILRTQQKIFYTAGRPPWYNYQDQKLVEPLVIGICGGSASGKTTVANKIITTLGIQWVTLLSMDSFYKVLSEEQHAKAALNEYNFDHPDAIDFDLLKETLQRLKEGKKVEVPIYNFITHRREPKTVSMYGADVLIFEGILAFYLPEIVNMLDVKVFVDADPDLRLSRRLMRDIKIRGRNLHSVLEQYDRHVKPAFDYIIAPSKIHADLIVPHGGASDVAINLIVNHVKSQLDARGFSKRNRNNHIQVRNGTGKVRPDSLRVLPLTPQIQGLHTFIRNKDTPRDEFIFYSKRLIRLVIEYALSLLPYTDKIVSTPQGVQYRGKKCSVHPSHICGVSILRAGETMEVALTDVCKDIRVGKILIQSDPSITDPEPSLYYLRLPKDIQDYTVILMDSTVATGAASMMAIRVLLDHDVPEENIYLVSLLMAESGVHTIGYAFPKVNLVTTAVDAEINERFQVIPGFGNFGDRYFGT